MERGLKKSMVPVRTAIANETGIRHLGMDA
jgi:hypothetical protein